MWHTKNTMWLPYNNNVSIICLEMINPFWNLDVTQPKYSYPLLGPPLDIFKDLYCQYALDNLG